MKYIILTTGVFFATSCFCSISPNLESDANNRFIISAGLGITSTSDSSQIIIGLETPSCFDFKVQGGELPSSLGAIIGGEILYLGNFNVKHQTFYNTHSYRYSFGLISRNHITENIKSYTKAALTSIKIDPDLSNDHIWTHGYQIGFGSELKYKSFFSYLELLYYSSNLKADKVPGSPRLFDHVSVSMGTKTYL